MWPQHSAFSPSMCSNIYLDIDFSRLNDVDKYYIWPKISRNICGSRDSNNKCPDTRTLTKATELYRNVKV